MNMYKSSRLFSREQLVFFTQVAIAAALDAVDANMEGKGQDTELTPDVAQEIIQPAITQLGWTLSIFTAQVTDEGMGVADAIDITVSNDGKDLDDVMQDYGLQRAKSDETKMPNTRDLAVAYVDKVFRDYLSKV